MPHDLHLIRTTIITALFSDDRLVKRLVVKGGNALELVHGIAQRGSIDVDLSMPDEFAADELEEAEQTFKRVLTDRFDALCANIA